MMDGFQGCIAMKASFLSKKSKKKLHQQLKIEKGKSKSDRIRIILLLNDGWDHKKISNAFFIDRKTVFNYKKRYIEYGIEGLLNDSYFGKRPCLSEEEKVYLEEELEKRLFRSVSEIIDYVEKKFGIMYSPSGMKYLLRELGFSFKKPKGVPAKADQKVQKEFSRYLKWLISILKNKNRSKKGRVLFGDCTHPTHSTELKFGWIKKGEEFWVKTPGGRYRLNIQGAICPRTLNVIARDYKTINKFTVCEFLMEIRKKYPDFKERIHLVLDNASYYTANCVLDLSKKLNIRLVFLPAYSPNLNLIERFWKFMKKKVFSRYYKTHEEFRVATKKFFQYIRKYKNDLRTIIRPNFQILDSSLAR